MHIPRKPSYRLVSPVSSGSGGGSRKISALEWMQALSGYLHSCAVLVLGCCLLLSLAPISDWRWGSHAALNTTISGAANAASSTAAVNAAANQPSHTHQGVAVGGGGGDYPHSAHAHAGPRWWLESPTSFGISVLFVCSICYFCFQILALHCRGRFSSSKGQRVLLHHGLAIVGLGACVATGRDGPLALVGFVLAEAANPPYFVLQLCKYPTKSSWLRSNGSARSSATGTQGRVLRWLLRPLLYLCLSLDLGLLHVLTFLLTRLMVLQFTAHAVMPFASLLTTKVTATALTLLSAVQFLDHLPALQDGPERSFKMERMSIVMQLREMQQGCYEDAAAAAVAPAETAHDEDHSSNHSRATSKRHPPSSRGSGGGQAAGNSPRTAAAAADADSAESKRSTPSSLVAAARKKLLWS